MPGCTTHPPSDITSGGTMPQSPAPRADWEKVLFAAAYLQKILPQAVLVGGSASALLARHRISLDADHVLTDLKQRFDQVDRKSTRLNSSHGYISYAVF